MTAISEANGDKTLAQQCIEPHTACCERTRQTKVKSLVSTQDAWQRAANSLHANTLLTRRNTLESHANSRLAWL
jgi:hypothetical protein